MKKLLVFILICLSSTVMLAQKATTLHWTPVKTADNMSMSAVLVIDGEEIGADALNLEIGIFDQDDVCRGAKLPKLKNGRYKYSPMIYGDNTTTSYYCKVYNHLTEEEMDLTYIPNTEDPLVWVANHTYGTTSQPYVFAFSSGETPTTYEREITGYGEDNNGGYVLVASPVSGVNPIDAGMFTDITESTYDLFRFDQTAALQWLNYKNTQFTLEPGVGYLYASKNDVTISISGTPYNGDGSIDLVYEEGYVFSGFNLIGNPFTTPASLDMPYYKLDETGSYFDATLEDGNVGKMEGVLVQATAATTMAHFTPVLTKGVRTTVPAASIVVSNNGKAVDKAIIRFDEGSTLGKMQLKENSSKLYIPQNGKDYAIANVMADEMPLNFKAETTGQYSISFQLNDANLGYLHLFDKLTGEDVDLLIDPVYSFIGSPRDNEDRFIVRFSENSFNDMFAYQNGSEIIVNGEGTLQVYDVMGRFVASYEINGSERINASQFSNTVFIFRLVGETVKTQKIVVR